MTPRAGKYVLAGTALVVAVAVAIGLWTLGSPATERARHVDERRVGDLGTLARALDVVTSRRGALPSSLDDLDPAIAPPNGWRDPDTGQLYEYRPLGPGTYELCATFQEAGGPGLAGSFWSHAAGRQCFRLDTRPVTP